MKKASVRRVTLSALICVGLLGASACSATDSQSETEETIGGQVIAPITVEADTLDGSAVELIVGQVLNVNTGDIAPETFTGESSDPLVAEFQPGNDDDSAVFNPGVIGVSHGTAEITMIGEGSDASEITFIVTVVAANAK